MSPKQPEPQALDDLQRWMLAAIQRPHRADGADDPALDHALAEAAAHIRPSPTLTPSARLAIYSDMYFARLRDVLRADFPCLHAMTGDATFSALARAFLTHHPSRRFTLFTLGGPLPDFLSSAAAHAACGGEAACAALRAMASLEWAVHVCFHAPDAPALQPTDLHSLSDDDWAAATFRMAPGFAALALTHDAHAALTAFRSGQPLPADAASPRPAFAAVWRRGVTVWRRPLSAPQHATLSALAAGLTLSDALDAASATWTGDPDALDDQVSAWFGEWVLDGMFSAVLSPLSVDPPPVEVG